MGPQVLHRQGVSRGVALPKVATIMRLMPWMIMFGAGLCLGLGEYVPAFETGGF